MSTDIELSKQQERESELVFDQETLDKNNLTKQELNHIQKLEEIRTLPLHKRIFRKMETGSLRGVVIMWIRMTLGIGILTLPSYVKVYGAFPGLILIIISALINYQAYIFIFQASKLSQKESYPDLIKELLGQKIYNIFQVTFMLDICSTVMIYCIVSWNLFEYMLFFFNIGEKYWDEWFVNIDTVSFDENNPTIMIMRYVFFGLVFLFTIPLFLKKSMDSLQKITVLYLSCLFVLVGYIIMEFPLFARAYKVNKMDPDVRFMKSPSYNWPENIFGLLVAYYVQPFIFSLRGELLLPSLRRTQKIAVISVGIECFLFCILGFFGYLVFGENFTPQLFVLRKPYPDKNWVSERIFQIIISVFFVLNVLGLAMYNPSIRDYVSNFYDLEVSKKRYIAVSLVPFFFICLCAAIYPNITEALNLFGFTVYNFNGYIIPILLKLKVMKIQGQKNYVYYLSLLWLAFFIFIGCLCLLFRCLGKVND